MPTELEHPKKHTNPMDGCKITDPWVEQKERDLAEVEKSLNGLMKRMASAKAAMEKAQGSDLYTRYAFAFDLVSLEYKNAWQQCRILKQDLFIHSLSETVGIQQRWLDETLDMMRSFENRQKLTERHLRMLLEIETNKAVAKIGEIAKMPENKEGGNGDSAQK